MANYQTLATEPKFGSAAGAPKQEAPMCINQVPRSSAKTPPKSQQADGNYISHMSSLGACLGAIGELTAPVLCAAQFLIQLSMGSSPGCLSDIPPQSVMTKDNCNIQIDSVVYFHIINPVTATFDVHDVQRAFVERTQPTLRQILAVGRFRSV
ncbi:hypothetical protein BJ742DRAFT_906497 [Cladochytrium replicatum]|nr:hypothetical protein BJ742DRAFT_906497 [Cladochytrium replicatum]